MGNVTKFCLNRGVPSSGDKVGLDVPVVSAGTVKWLIEQTTSRKDFRTWVSGEHAVWKTRGKLLQLKAEVLGLST